MLLVDDDAADNDAELRVDLGGAYDTGTVSANVMYASDEDQTAYITLYGESASSSYLIADVLMDESYKIDSDVGARLRGDAIYNDATLDEFSADTWTNISVDWDSVNSEYSVTIGDETYGPFVMQVTDEVEYIAFKIGSKSNITTSSTPLYLDDIIVTDGTSEIFSDDFESYTVGDDLTGTGSYSSSGYGATVSDAENSTSSTTDEDDSVTDDFESYTVGATISDASTDWLTANIDVSIAKVSDINSADGSNSLYIEDLDTDGKPYAYREFSAAATAGSVSLDVYVPSTNAKTTYINIGDGKNNSDRYFEVRLSSSLGYENSADGDVALDTDYTQDEWHTITIEWTADNLVTLYLDDVAVATDIDQTSLGLTADIVPSQLTIYTGDTTGDANEVYIDNVDSDQF